MKKISYITLLLFSLLLATACKEYLDIAPESGLEEETVFTKYENFLPFFNKVYNMKAGSNSRDFNIRLAHPRYIDYIDQKLMIDGLTDACDQGRIMIAQPIKQGVFGQEINKFTYDQDRRPVLDAMFRVIRTCNLTLENIDRVKDAPSQEELDDIRAQAYFIRGYAYFALCRFWGGMPYIYKPLATDQSWDLKRLSAKDTYIAIAADCDTAYTYFVKAKRIRRDAREGGNTSADITADKYQAYPSGVAAKALKSRALLYAASPLYNTQNDTKLWENAAIAAKDAIEVALANNFSLLAMKDWYRNCYENQYTNEQLWAWNYGSKGYGDGANDSYMCAAFKNNNGTSSACPTQNLVDRYENTSGDVLTTESDRTKALAAGRFHPQDPYYTANTKVKLDPRFYQTIFHNGQAITWASILKSPHTILNQMNTWRYLAPDGKYIYGDHNLPDTEGGLRGFSRTGYYMKRLTGDQSVRNQKTWHYTEPTFRLGELYLNYAEAVNEMSGPNGSVAGYPLTAKDALNVIRTRAQMPNVKDEFLGSKESFRPRIKNERVVELMFESDHYYFDTNRWKDSEILRNQVLYGMSVDVVDGAPTADYPHGGTSFPYTKKAFHYVYKREPLDVSRQIKFTPKMYYWPFNIDDYFMFKNFDMSLNPSW
ncbi:MAG: RagB/SusD family nutrient uptake outer membrane protein [Prolixibacteraceae bacterium]|nr:RagB/SusD family nutrient uptake outer membrane protein [Prolixibacteraceae bacterium]